MSFIIDEMQICRDYCTEIHRIRQKSGFVSLRYPLISVKLNRYFLPEFRSIIAEECNLIGYMDIQPIEYDFNQLEMVILDTTKTTWQDDLFKERSIKREIAEIKKNNQ